MSFYDNLDRFAANVAVVKENGEKVLYSQMIKTADEIAERLRSRSLVFLICENNFYSVCAYIGCLRKRVVPAMLSSAIDPSMIESLKDMYHPRHIIRCCDNAAEGYIIEETEYAVDYSINDELAILLTTSGSTGSPKLVRQSYMNINSNAEAIAQYLKISSDDRPITTLPISYTYGLSIINSHLLCGSSIVLTNKTLMEKDFWIMLRDNYVTTFGGVPYTYEMLRKLRFDRMNLASLKILTQAGGKLTPELSLEFAKVCRDKNITFVVMYGQTEATARMSYLPAEFSVSKAGSIGIAIPGGTFNLIDETGNIIDDHEVVGELVYEGKNVTLGYAESRFDLAKGDENYGRLKTGDMAKRDSDGFYYIVGRKKRFLKLFGNRVNLEEVERLLRSEGYDCACGGEDDLLKIYTTDEKLIPEIKNCINRNTTLKPNSYSIYIIAKIPRNEAGKIVYADLNNV